MDNLSPCRLKLRVKFFVEPHLTLQEQTRYVYCRGLICSKALQIMVLQTLDSSVFFLNAIRLTNVVTDKSDQIKLS